MKMINPKQSAIRAKDNDITQLGSMTRFCDGEHFSEVCDEIGEKGSKGR